MTTTIYAERWVAIEGYEGLYEISDHGRARSLDRIDCAGRRLKGRMMKNVESGKGYRALNLSKDGKQTMHYVHRLVAKAFCEGYDEGLEVCHNDGDRTNNHYTNLRWDTRSNNHADKVKHGTHTRGERCPTAIFTNDQVREIRRLYATGEYTQTELAEMFNSAQQTISQIIQYKRYAYV